VQIRIKFAVFWNVLLLGKADWPGEKIKQQSVIGQGASFLGHPEDTFLATIVLLSPERNTV